MDEYHKIQSIYKRDLSKQPAPFIVGAWTESAFDYLQNNQWEFSEKIDGTNIRVMYDGENITFGGKTEAASIPAHLANKLNDLFLPITKRQLFKETFKTAEAEPEDQPKPLITLYGEGFGHKIQGKVGVDYLMQDVDFCLFDIKIGYWWLERKDVYAIGEKLGLKTPKVVGYGTIQEAIELVKKGFKSSFGTADAEGLILRPTTELKDRSGKRIITKIKCRDFQI